MSVIIKRRAATLLFFLLLAFVVIGCGRKTSERPQLVLLTPGGPVRKAVESAVERFRLDNPGVEVQIVTTPGKDYYVKSLTMLAGRAHVDLLWMGQGFGMFASREALLDLNPMLREDPELLASFQPDVVDWYRFGGKLYGIPYGIDCLVIAYNKALFEKAGVPFPSPDWTLDEMIEKARQLQQTDAKTGRIEIAGLGIADLDFRYYNLSLLDQADERFALNSPEGKAWLARGLELLHGERLIHRGTEMQSMDRLSRFFNGRAAMMPIATWDITEVRNRMLHDWDIVRLQKGTSGKNLSWASSAGFSISARSRHPELSMKLLRYLVGPEFQTSMFEATIPTDRSLHEAFLAAHPAPPAHLKEFLMMLDGLRPSPRITAFQEVESEWLYWFEQIMLKQISLEEGLSNAETRINRILELHRKEGSQP